MNTDLEWTPDAASVLGASGLFDSRQAGSDKRQCYSAGVMVLSREQPCDIRYRSTDPVMTPATPDERRGTIANVVFPTGIDRRDDVCLPDRFDVYYGMADYGIGVARLDLPEHLPAGALPDLQRA